MKVSRRVKKVYFVVSGIFCVLVIIALIVSTNILEQKHKGEIERVIKNAGGKVIEVIEVDGKDSPFGNEISMYNTTYKVIYELEGETRIAWYRGVKTVNDIHDQSPGKFNEGYGEKWLFDRNENL